MKSGFLFSDGRTVQGIPSTVSVYIPSLCGMCDCEIYTIEPISKKVTYSFPVTSHFYFKSKADLVAFQQGKEVVYSGVIYQEYNIEYKHTELHFGSCSIEQWIDWSK